MLWDPGRDSCEYNIKASKAQYRQVKYRAADGRATSGKRKGGRQSKSAEKAAKRRRMVGGVLKTVGTAAPGQQCTQCGTQVQLAHPMPPCRSNPP